MARTRGWLVLALAAAACGGGRSSSSIGTSRSDGTAGPADVPAMRALLARFAPAAERIVATYEALPTTFVLGDTTITLSHSGGFADYWPDGEVDNLVDNMATAVHEVYHAYSGTRGYALLVEDGGARGEGVEAVDVGAPMLVRYVARFPAGELDATFPADARTARYPVYVYPSEPNHGTQLDGVYGLLDEWAAYYQGARVRFDLWPWVRDVAPAHAQLVLNYVARYHEMWVPYAELKLFILHYLRHARDRRPDAYRAIVGDPGFRRAFVAVDAAYAGLLAEAGRLEPAIHAFARSRGVDAGLADGQLTVDGTPFTIRDDAYPAVLRHLASEAYRPILADLAPG
jgi:hypothetical protein